MPRLTVFGGNQGHNHLSLGVTLFLPDKTGPILLGVSFSFLVWFVTFALERKHG